MTTKIKLIPHCEIYRLEQNPQHGTFGVMLICQQTFCCTIELPDRDNANDISRIPAGVYSCKKQQSARFGAVFEIMSVPDRSDIVIHIGNTIKDTRGCILLGRSFGWIGNNRAILHSAETFSEFMHIMRDVLELQLSIYNGVFN